MSFRSSGKHPNRDGACKNLSPFRGAALSMPDAEAHRHANQLGDVLGAELVENPRAMNLDGARTDAELTAGFLVGGAGDKFLKHVALTRRELAEAIMRGRSRGDARLASVQ